MSSNLPLRTFSFDTSYEGVGRQFQVDIFDVGFKVTDDEGDVVFQIIFDQQDLKLRAAITPESVRWLLQVYSMAYSQGHIGGRRSTQREMRRALGLEETAQVTT